MEGEARSGLVFVGTGLIRAGEIQGAAEQRSLSEIAACSLSVPPSLCLSLLEMFLTTGKRDKYDNCPYSHFPHSQSAVYKVFIEHVSPLKVLHGKLGEELQPPPPCFSIPSHPPCLQNMTYGGSWSLDLVVFYLCHHQNYNSSGLQFPPGMRAFVCTHCSLPA